MSDPRTHLESLLSFPLYEALYGRRSRRFGLGMEIPSGPLRYRSQADPTPLSELERMVLVAAATGVSGWSFGVPFGPRTPETHADISLRFTGRTAPTAAGLGTPAVFFSDDAGSFATVTREVTPSRMHESGDGVPSLERLLETCRRATRKIGDGRLDLPSSPPYILPPNLWWANRPGSTLFMPVGDASEECFGFLALMIRHGVMVMDEDTGRPAGELDSFVRSGLLDPEKQLPIAELLTDVNDSLCLELAFIGHNIVLAMQAVGLGGLYFNGMDGISALVGAPGDEITGLGFRSVEDERWTVSNPVGLDGVFEALCPPYYPDMRAAAERFVARKFGPGGAFDPEGGGPWREASAIKAGVSPYGDEFASCLAEVAQYLFDKFGKFPGTRSTIMLPGFVQAHHLDTGFYDQHYQEGAYLRTHSTHFAQWHGTTDGAGRNEA